MNNEQFNALSETVNNIAQAIHQDDVNYRQQQARDKLINDQTQVIRKCDGNIPSEVREWLEEIEISIPSLNNLYRPNAAMIEVVTKTIIGPLRKAVEYFLQAQPARDATLWQDIREHIIQSFLTANENEKLKADVERFRQLSYDTIHSFNRRFSELIRKAYPVPRNQDVQRLLIRAYTRALHDQQLAKRMIVNNRPQNIEAAMQYTANQAAGEEMFQCIGFNEEPMEVDSTAPIGKVKEKQEQSSTEKIMKRLDSLSLQNERMSTKMAKLEATARATRQENRHLVEENVQLHRRLGHLQTNREQASHARNPDVQFNRGSSQNRRPGNDRTRSNGPVCYRCQKPGHIQRNCPKNNINPGN